jgi:hypothetical protein
MLRRLLETLIIEAYEHLGRESEIKDGGGNYLMLSDLAERACGEKVHKGLNLGRDSRTALKEVRNVAIGRLMPVGFLHTQVTLPISKTGFGCSFKNLF